MNVLVAGGAGFIGSHLIDVLLNENNNVVCVDNFCLGSKDMISHHIGNSGFAFYECDICDADGLRGIFAEYAFERVYHLAANSDIQKGGKDPTIDIYNTFGTTLSILRTMRDFCVKELLFASTSAVYGEKQELLREDAGGLCPVSYYGGAKLASEAFISAFAAMNDMAVNIIRFPNVVGPRLTHGVIYDFITKLKANPHELEILGDGKQEKPYIYVLDLIDSMLSMKYEKGVQIFNAGVETTTTVERIADIVCEEMKLSDVRYRFTGDSVGWKGDVAKFQYDLSKIHAFGWQAKYASDEAVRLAARNSL